MRNNEGFSLIEVMIVIAIIAILAAIVIPATQADEERKKSQESNYHTLCINGYQFISGRYNSDKVVQVIDSEGRGVPCR